MGFVEDETSVRDLTRRMLEESGYRVLPAANGRDALRLCAKAEHIDLMVTDIVMPEMRGVEVARRVAHIRPAVRVLLMSGYTDNSIDLESAGSISFLQKPFTLGALLGAVRSVLDAPAPPGFPAGDLAAQPDEEELVAS